MLGPQLEALVVENEELHLCRINIDNWDSEVARQYGISSLPLLMLYDDQRLITVGTEEVLNELAAR